jgi:hypothetical protein
MIKRLSFGVAILAFSMACGKAPTAPTPVATPPAPPVVAAAKIVSLTMRVSRNVIYFPESATLFVYANFDDGSVMPHTPTWESNNGTVTLLSGGPQAFAISVRDEVGTAIITARAAGLSVTESITVRPGYRPR